MIRLSLAISLVCFSLLSYSQKARLINSGEVMDAAQVLFDSAKYKEAIEEYLKIPEPDTNYVEMLNRILPAYYGAEQYDKVIQVCEKGLAMPTIHRANFLRMRALATDKNGDYVKSQKLFAEAIAEFPVDAALQFSLGVTHFNNKNFEKATETFFKVLSFSPFHSGSHLNLGLLSIRQGRKTHAMFSLGMYLAINNTDNQRLVLLNNMTDNQVTDEGSLPAFDKNGAEKLDQIIRAKIALDKNFKSSISFAAPVVMQYEMLFQQLNTINETGDDPYVRYYLPVYKAIKEQNSIEPFLYHILASSSNDGVRKWRSKNEKALDAFFLLVNQQMIKSREKLALPSLKFDQPVSVTYKNNLLSGIGEKNSDGLPTGAWLYFHNNGQTAAKGLYDDKGEKTGVWNYYTDKGLPKSIEDYNKKEVTLLYENGNKREHFFLKDNEIDGNVELYYSCGVTKENLQFKAGERNGKGTEYYPNGKVKLTFEYVAGKANGEFVDYYENGKPASRRNFTNDLLNGKYYSYFANGNVHVEGQYINDEPTGIWKYYYQNGQLDYSGKYEKGFGVGEWKYYDANGKPAEIRIFNDKGEFQGENVVYTDGIKHQVSFYKNGLLTKIFTYNAEGKELSRAENDKGTFSIKGYYLTGQLRSEGQYVKGKQSGLWKFYHRNGNVESEYRYVDGLIQGESREYYETGEKRYISQYKDDELDGYFQHYYSHGILKSEGWYENGVRSQQWYDYYGNGQPEASYYYRSGNLHGKYLNYDVDGKLYSITEYDNDEIKDIVMLNREEQPSSKSTAGVIEEFYKSGKPKLKYEILCGYYTNHVTKWFPNGVVFLDYAVLNGKRNGPYLINYIEGKPSTVGMCINDEEEGIWKNYYDNGTLSSQGKYVGGKSDSVWTYYFPDGKISRTAEYMNDKRNGVTRIYSPEGGLLVEKRYQMGDLIGYRFKPEEAWIPFTGTGKIIAKYADGNTALDEEYKNQVREGYKNLYYDNGKLCESFLFKNGDYEGPYTLYFKTGKVREKGEYKLDEREGLVEYFNENGTLRKSEQYKGGVKHGKVTLYENGNKSKEYIFRDGFTE